jgi:hypothetical protein
MTADGIIRAARGLRIARRGHPTDMSEVDLRIIDVSPVTIPPSTPVEARTVDGHLWHRLWSLPDRLVIDFVDDVQVEVRDDGSIVFSRALPRDLEDHFLLDHVLPHILASRGDLVLHSGVLIRDGRGVVVTGHSGAGKSTLTAFLGQRNWAIGGDDAAVVDIGPPVTVQATYPTVRLLPEAAELLGLPPDVGVDVAGKRRLDLPADRTLHEPVALAAVVRLMPVSASERAEFTRIRGAAALDTLMTNAFHVDIGQGRLLGQVLGGLAQVAESVLVGDLSVPRGPQGLIAAEQALSDLVFA